MRNGGLTGADIVEGSLGPVPNADTLDGKDSKDFARLGGLVNGDGSILQGSGFTVSHPDEGEYQISFPSGTLSNANCPPMATAMVFAGIVRHPQISGRSCSGLGGRVVHDQDGRQRRRRARHPVRVHGDVDGAAGQGPECPDQDSNLGPTP